MQKNSGLVMRCLLIVILNSQGDIMYFGEKLENNVLL